MVGFIAANWLWIALVAAMILVLRGGCGHRSHGGRTQDTTPACERGGHRHGSYR